MEEHKALIENRELEGLKKERNNQSIPLKPDNSPTPGVALAAAGSTVWAQMRGMGSFGHSYHRRLRAVLC